MRRHVESHSVPAIAVEIDREPAVRRLAFDFAAHVPERDAAVQRMEFGDALEVVDGDAAVVRVQSELRAARHVNLEADRPALATARIGADCADARRRFDVNPGHHPARVSVGFAISSDDGSHQHVTAIPTGDLDAAVRAGIDIQRGGAADGFFADFTE
jgi:hypothetical protein